jgi:hypothetical protein
MSLGRATFLALLASLSAGLAGRLAGGVFIDRVFEGSLTSTDFDFQASTATLDVSWVGFIPSGFYEVALGTSPGAEDAVPFTNVGFVTSHTLTGLNLAPGGLYFVTIRGNYMGTTPTEQGDGITIEKPLGASAVLGAAPFTITFAQQMSGIVLYEWNFDAPVDGAPDPADFVSQSGGDASFTYTVPGTYDAVLRVTHQTGDTLIQRVAGIRINPSPAPPSAGITTVPSPPAVPAGTSVTLTGSASTFDGTVVSYLWDFDGDGVADASSATSPVIQHTFTAQGSFNVGLTVVDGVGNRGTSSVTVNVGPPAAGDFPTVSAPSVTATGGLLTGNVVSFSVNVGNGGTGTVTRVLWDFDGNGEIDRITPSPASPVTETWQYESPGSFTAEVTVEDTDNLSASAQAAVPVGLGTATRRCWIVQPATGFRVWGNHVSVIAQAVPETSIAQVAFEYRASPAGAWTPIGTASPVPEEVLGVFWDVTALAQGAPGFDLRAVATFTDLSTASSEAIQIPTVIVDPGPHPAGTPFVEEFSGSPWTRLLTVGTIPGATTNGTITRDMTLKLLAGTIPSYDQMRLERRGDNPRPVEGRLQGLKFFPGKFRRTSLAANQALGKPSKVTMYLAPQPGNRLADGTDLTQATFKIYRFEPSRSRWEPLLPVTSSRSIVRAAAAATGELGVVVELGRTDTGGSDPGCGSTGMGAAALAMALFLRWRRRGRR